MIIAAKCPAVPVFIFIYIKLSLNKLYEKWGAIILEDGYLFGAVCYKLAIALSDVEE